MHIAFGERVATIAAFDRFVEYTDTALRDPRVVSSLGGLAVELRRINEQAFLPNLRDGRFVTPRNQRESDNLAIVPLTDEEADVAYDLIEPLIERRPSRTWSAAEAATSNRYGLHLPDELESVFEVGPPGDANAATLTGLRKATVARVQAAFNRSDDGQKYWASRPVLMARRRILDSGPMPCAATIAHEEGHASDLLEDGPLYGTLTYGAATELRSYHISAAIYEAGGVHTPEATHSSWVNSLRMAEVGSTDHPYTPNQRVIDEMVRTGII